MRDVRPGAERVGAGKRRSETNAHRGHQAADPRASRNGRTAQVEEEQRGGAAGPTGAGRRQSTHAAGHRLPVEDVARPARTVFVDRPQVPGHRRDGRHRPALGRSLDRHRPTRQHLARSPSTLYSLFINQLKFQ